jgi:hypothetical protein
MAFGAVLYAQQHLARHEQHHVEQGFDEDRVALRPIW